jgi:hypothetical protein
MVDKLEEEAVRVVVGQGSTTVKLKDVVADWVG